MMRQILRLRHWQILLLLLAYEFAIVGLLILSQFDLPRIIEAFVFGWMPMTIYPLLLGLGLNRHVALADEKTRKDFKTFVIFGCIWATIFFGTEIMKTTRIFERNPTNAQLISITIAIITLFVLFKFVQFPSRTIKSIKLKRDAGLWEYTADSFQILFWPLGIWWIQPRINKIADKKN